MRGDRVSRLALLTAAWAAVPTSLLAQTAVSDQSAAPRQYVGKSRPTAPLHNDYQLPSYLRAGAGAQVASNGAWIGGSDGLSFNGTTFITIIPSTWNVAANWDGGAVPDNGGTSLIANPDGPANPVE